MDRKVQAGTIEKAKSDIVGTVSKYVELTKKGNEFTACCPFHSERTPSFTVMPDKGAFYCFGCGEGGDAVDFVSKYENIGFREAVASIVGDLPASGGVPAARQAVKKEEEPEWEPVVPVPAGIKQRPMDIFNRRKGDGWERLTSSKRWAYLDANGDLIGYVCRFELPGGGKDVLPQCYCVNKATGETRWRWLSFDKPRPLYGLNKLAKHPLAQVIIAEGEKAADAAQALYEAAGISRDKLVVVSWPGGGKAVKFTDWSPLAGRNVGLWPDADQKPYVDTHPKAGQLMPFLEQPGTVCMLDIADRIEGQVKALKFIEPPSGVPDGWDLADELPAGFNLLAHTKSAALLIADFRAKYAAATVAADLEEALPWDDQLDAEDMALAVGIEPVAVAAPTPVAVAAPVLDPIGDHDDNELIKNGFFTILGYDGGAYYFFQHEKRQVLERTKGDFTDTGLIELAPLNWWEEYFPGSNGGIDKKSAADWIFRTANSRGIYDSSKVRGRGAWTDKGRSVFHHGAYLTVDGVPTSITAIKSGYVYPMARSLPDPDEKPLTDEEGAWLISVAEMARWSTPGSAALFAGFVMLAPICGALPWRSHIWLTGGAGSGKSTLQAKYAGALLRDTSVYAQGNSTEAGIRQELKADALPVLIDEIESNNEGDKKRVENIIQLIRQTSTESQAKTLKGTVTGHGQNYHIRSMFCLASINVNLPGKADIDRLTRLVLRPPAPGTEEQWVKLETELNKIDSDTSISGRLLARALKLMPVILETTKVFRRAAAKHFGTQRDGDQFGTLLAGCWCLQKSHVPSEAEAMVLIKGYDWTEHTEDHDQDDSKMALASIMGSKLRLGGSMGDQTVYTLVREAHSLFRVGAVDVILADQVLRSHGIRLEEKDGVLLFGTGVPNLKKLVADTPFASDVRGQLLRLPGASKYQDKSVRFNGQGSKCVAVPISLILEGQENTTEELPI